MLGYFIGKGTEELKPIDESQIIPINPCACGEEDMHLRLNTNSEKAGNLSLEFLYTMYIYRVHREH